MTKEKSELHPDFSMIGNSTSDHSYQQIAVELPSKIKIRGGTWNTMNKCFPKPDSASYTNNPMNIEETHEEHGARKQLQCQIIVKRITEAQKQGKELDFIFLQEIDWMTSKQTGKIRDDFIKSLKTLGWSYVMTSPTRKGGERQQPLLTLYNEKKLEPITGSSKGVFLESEPRPKYRGFQTSFTHKATKKTVDLVNFHLNYQIDHREDLRKVMETSIEKGHIIIMGGDANHSPNFQMEYLTGDWFLATAVDNNKTIFDETGKIVMTLHHLDANKKGVIKHYDGFCAGSPDRLKIHEEQGEHFELIDGKVHLKPDLAFKKHSSHLSEPGYPWMRTRALLVELDKKLIETSNDDTKQKEIYEQMVCIAKTRLNKDLAQAAKDKNYPLPNVINFENKKTDSLTKNRLSQAPASFFSSYPKTYTQFHEGHPESFDLAKALLNDYTKNNSAFSRFIHGHWNRHHVDEVKIILEAIHTNKINDTQSLLVELRKIDGKNPQGSLAKRIAFIEKVYNLESNIAKKKAF